ncbi:YidH family protein [Caminibacter pacificus]
MNSSNIDPKNLMALERAVAALIGIAISFIALGFIIEKFELFLHLVAMQLGNKSLSIKAVENASFYKWMGISIILAGAILAIYSYFYYTKWIELLQKGELDTDKKVFLVLALFVAAIAVILILSMIWF